MSDSIILDKDAGVNPTIPVCPVCGEPKNEIMLTGAAGGKWARKNGRSDGQMPMYVHLADDCEPCDECKKKGVAIFEVDDETHHLTGFRWLVTEACIKRLLRDEALEKALKGRVVLIKENDAYQLGFHAEVK